MKKLIVKYPNDAEYEQLKIDAHQHNCNLSDYIRYLVAKERKEMESKWSFIGLSLKMVTDVALQECQSRS